jgi:primosomal protein N' (replication factor Y) (superfamily II helicase)
MPRHLNVARVVLDNPLPHLDRLFDYEIPEELDEICVPGVKVKVKFSNRNMEAWVVEKVALSSHHKKLSEISKVISNYPVLTPEVLTLSQIVADRFIGNLTDVLRFAIPPRQAKIEKAFKFESIKSSKNRFKRRCRS